MYKSIKIYTRTRCQVSVYRTTGPLVKIHTCHKLWTEIYEIRQISKGDMIEFCEIFTKITLKRPQNSQIEDI